VDPGTKAARRPVAVDDNLNIRKVSHYACDREVFVIAAGSNADSRWVDSRLVLNLVRTDVLRGFLGGSHFVIFIVRKIPAGRTSRAILVQAHRLPLIAQA
jgi:hypothetical protein